jgi:hypothetical protein
MARTQPEPPLRRRRDEDAKREDRLVRMFGLLLVATGTVTGTWLITSVLAAARS